MANAATAQLARLQKFIQDAITGSRWPLAVAVLGASVAVRFVPQLQSVDVVSVITALTALGFLSTGRGSMRRCCGWGSRRPTSARTRGWRYNTLSVKKITFDLNQVFHVLIKGF